MNLREIKLRIRSIRKTQQITRAMKMVSAVKFRHAEERLLNSRPYAARMHDLAVRALNQYNPTDEPHPLLQQRLVRRILLVVVASDMGLCGSFNHNIYRAVQKFLREQSAVPAETRLEVGLWLIGKKINDLFKHLHVHDLSCSVYRYLPQAQADYAAIGKELTTLFSEGRYDQVDVFFTKFKSVVQNSIAHESLLPLAVAPGAPAPPAVSNMLLEPDLTDILADLLPRFLLTRIHEIMMESETSEQGTRMSMMDHATQNADDLIGHLMLDFNKARQWNITCELSDITTGAEAMS